MSEADPGRAGERFSPRQALDNARAVDVRARRHGRWPAWMWLGMAVVMPAYLLGSQLGDGTWVEDVAGWLIPLAALVGVVYAAMQRAESRLMNRLTWPVTAAFMALVILDVALVRTVLDDGPTALVVGFGLLTAVPPIYGAWRVLRA